MLGANDVGLVLTSDYLHSLRQQQKQQQQPVANNNEDDRKVSASPNQGYLGENIDWILLNFNHWLDWFDWDYDWIGLDWIALDLFITRVIPNHRDTVIATSTLFSLMGKQQHKNEHDAITKFVWFWIGWFAFQSFIIGCIQPYPFIYRSIRHPSTTNHRCLVRAGVITNRDATSYWMSIPDVGPLLLDISQSRKQVARMIQQKKYKEILLRVSMRFIVLMFLDDVDGWWLMVDVELGAWTKKSEELKVGYEIHYSRLYWLGFAANHSNLFRRIA